MVATIAKYVIPIIHDCARWVGVVAIRYIPVVRVKAARIYDALNLLFVGWMNVSVARIILTSAAITWKSIIILLLSTLTQKKVN